MVVRVSTFPLPVPTTALKLATVGTGTSLFHAPFLKKMTNSEHGLSGRSTKHSSYQSEKSAEPSTPWCLDGCFILCIPRLDVLYMAIEYVIQVLMFRGPIIR